MENYFILIQYIFYSAINPLSAIITSAVILCIFHVAFCHYFHYFFAKKTSDTFMCVCIYV